ncbi:50S ribosomal protein L6 [Bacteroidetes bacterium endosymbiont of Geopemphigus sp.]|uniref:50S ribosomal protein L6 n=1 Tax=Bacteroidetes bacterium endosymbiont of Geopemphigus sp. TaxID=2047937 RepID=UPI000CD25BA4|nr:50S ribosomal protein L6 [Bacteroidetes bacterium endosymbiont of Geopemphigus sp.]
MSRIGKLPVPIPHPGVVVDLKDDIVRIKGPLGELSQQLSPRINLELNQDQILLKRVSESKQDKAMHGLYRSLINNMIIGVNQGFTKELELVGVGYRATAQGQILEMTLGFSHNIVMELPLEIKLETKAEKGKNPLIILRSYDKQLIGMVAAKIRSFRKPEPYKGKGVRYVGEYIRRKAGKSA